MFITSIFSYFSLLFLVFLPRISFAFIPSIFFLCLCLCLCSQQSDSVRPPVRPSFRPSVRPSVRLSVRPSVHPSVRPSVNPSVRPSVPPSVPPSLRLFVHLPIRLLVCFSMVKEGLMASSTDLRADMSLPRFTQFLEGEPVVP